MRRWEPNNINAINRHMAPDTPSSTVEATVERNSDEKDFDACSRPTATLPANTITP